MTRRQANLVAITALALAIAALGCWSIHVPHEPAEHWPPHASMNGASTAREVPRADPSLSNAAFETRRLQLAATGAQDARAERSIPLQETAGGAAPVVPTAPPDSNDLEVGAMMTRWNQEQTDERWTQTLTDHIATSMGDLAVDGRVRDVICRTSVCRARLEFRDAAEALHFAQLSASSPEKMRALPQMNAGKFSVDVFIQRDPESE